MFLRPPHSQSYPLQKWKFYYPLQKGKLSFAQVTSLKSSFIPGLFSDVQSMYLIDSTFSIHVVSDHYLPFHCRHAGPTIISCPDSCSGLTGHPTSTLSPSIDSFHTPSGVKFYMSLLYVLCHQQLTWEFVSYLS